MLSKDERTPVRGPAVLAGHLGEPAGAVVLVLPDARPPEHVELVAPDGAATVLTSGPVQSVPGWTAGPYARVELPSGAGRHVLRARFAGGVELVTELELGPDLLQRQTLSDVLAYFMAMRSSGEIDRKDRRALLWGDSSGREVDARGGWLDASGDTSKFLSHLTYTRTMSPQQIPLCAWAMLAARDALAARHPDVVRSVGVRLRDEALWGADFLVRFRAPEGYFYVGIFDALTKRLEERVINAPLPECVRTDRYQAAYRQGGGLAIAALARAATQEDHGEFTSAEYLSAAVDAFAYLEKHNVEHLDDGAENIVDDYCALLAAAELVGAGAVDAVGAARHRARSLTERYTAPDDGPGWFVADADGRPFFHAAEAGLPVLALLRFAELLPDAPEAGPARELALRAMQDVLARSATVPNPFGYPRQRVQPADGPPRDSFFFPHANETGYWWQGENATIASLSAAASACSALDGLGGLDAAERERLDTFAADQLAWITGRNPFDSSMLQGRGRNHVRYRTDFPNLPGGIANGITAGWTDENDIAFMPPDAGDAETWRWSEQWIPHTGWFLLAVAAAR
ncbi:glycoside hydrolase family 9 protein [Pseudonocardia sp. TRM90224]|uniref:glycoside hydrolase family 9 protein n=1 Tax=Pseudonocardia sp. TRM90224 TaxID=2812678 RepID=UPI001E50A28E|nr:glycoside hydrolase family 9 protein [Pseudonocardia sp. TRM90224]